MSFYSSIDKYVKHGFLSLHSIHPYKAQNRFMKH